MQLVFANDICGLLENYCCWIRRLLLHCGSIVEIYFFAIRIMTTPSIASSNAPIIIIIANVMDGLSLVGAGVLVLMPIVEFESTGDCLVTIGFISVPLVILFKEISSEIIADEVLSSASSGAIMSRPEIFVGLILFEGWILLSAQLA